MKQREFRLANAFLIILASIFALVTFRAYSNQPAKQVIEKSFVPNEEKLQIPETQVKGCTEMEPLEIKRNADANLNKLKKYQELCGSFVTDTLMIFTDMPTDQYDAVEDAKAMSQKLKLYDKNKIRPIIIVEPYINSGPMEYSDFLKGNYDFALQTYFYALKNEEITGEQMGTWIPFPESNTPNWANKDTEPNDFALAVNKYVAFQKKAFPNSKASILLNSATFDPNDLEWNNGDYLNLNAYIVSIDSSLIDSVGIQGFPWTTNATLPKKQIFDAKEFLQPEIAIAAARELKTKDIWFNTGTFGRKYTNDSTKTVIVSPSDRKAILESIFETALYVKNYQLNEYRVSINMFNQNKSVFNEATDWSYLGDPESEEIFMDFVSKLDKNDIELSLFDK